MSDSTTYRAVTFRLHPGSRARHVEIARTAGACRHVWNHFLAKNRREYALWKASHDFGGPECHGLERPPVTYQSLGVQFTQLRKATPWLAELPYLPVRYALKYQADAWKRAFERGGYPKFNRDRGQRGRECRVEYSGLGDWGFRTWRRRGCPACETSNCIRTGGRMMRQRLDTSPIRYDSIRSGPDR